MCKKLAYFPFLVEACTVRNVFKIEIHTFYPINFIYQCPKTAKGHDDLKINIFWTILLCMKPTYFTFDVEACTVRNVFKNKIHILAHNFLTVQQSRKIA